MRIGIDVRYLSHGLLGGVHTYIAHFVPALIEQAAPHDVFLYADTKKPFELDSSPPHVITRYLPWKSPLSSVYNDLFIRRQLAADHLDVMHFPANYGFAPAGVRSVITVHDAMNILPIAEIVKGLTKGHARRTPRILAMTLYLHVCTRQAVRRAHLLLTVSGHAKREIVRYSGFDPEKIVPIPHAVAPGVRRVEDRAVLDDVRHRHNLARPFVLADALKNPGAVVHAWRYLPSHLRASHQIVFFCRRSDPLPIVREAVATGEAQLLVRPSFDDLIALYSAADAFLFPSWLEGFGIPILEAMSCGAPVIASDRGSIPEVAGDAAILVDAEDAEVLAKRITGVLVDPREAQRLRERGFTRASQFSWNTTARQILDSYELAVQVA
jgi:glycosyltransferase involved in cell wall biosynthesis